MKGVTMLNRVQECAPLQQGRPSTKLINDDKFLSDFNLTYSEWERRRALCEIGLKGETSGETRGCLSLGCHKVGREWRGIRESNYIMVTGRGFFKRKMSTRVDTMEGDEWTMNRD